MIAQEAPVITDCGAGVDWEDKEGEVGFITVVSLRIAFRYVCRQPYIKHP
jgi:hypothetical protein